MPDAEAEVESEQLEAYRLTHDLAESLQGAVSPPLWVVRDGNNCWVASSAMTAAAPFEEIPQVLVDVGDFIAARLDELHDERSVQAVQAWHERDRHDRLRVIEAATGCPPQLVAEEEPRDRSPGAPCQSWLYRPGGGAARWFSSTVSLATANERERRC